MRAAGLAHLGAVMNTFTRSVGAATLIGIGIAGVFATVALREHPAGLPDLDRGPGTLRETGLYADAAMRAVAATNLPFAPQYPLWTDGAQKRRWIYLPPGTTIDASNPDAWQFPIGTRV